MDIPPRILVVAPFAHQNGHFVTFPRDISCGLVAAGCEVTLLHPRAFRTELDWHGGAVERICLRDLLISQPWWWRELWSRLADYPSNLCLAWIIWKVRRGQYDVVFWTDFQAQRNLWPLALARLLRLYRLPTAFVEHHPPEKEHKNRIAPMKWRSLRGLRVAGSTMFVFSLDLYDQWRGHLGPGAAVKYLPWGVWPRHLPEDRRAIARQELWISEDARVLLVFGVQAIKRKHIDTLLEACHSFVPAKPMLLLFVGAQLGAEKHPFHDWRSETIEVRMEEGFVPESRVESYFAAADMTWANYRDFPGASGALLQAMGYGRLSLCSNRGEIGALCRKHKLGLLVDSANEADLRQALDQFVVLPKELQIEQEKNIISAVCEHSWPVIARELMSSLGLSSMQEA